MNKLLLSTLLLFTACGSNSDTNNDEREISVEEKITSTLNSTNVDTDFTLLVKSEDDKTFSHSVGSSTGSTLYRSASTSKWVTATVILSLVKEGVLSLDDNPQDYIINWDKSGNLSKIKWLYSH